jgi:hypothetical protein
MLNILRKPRENDNLSTGIGSMNFLTADVKVRPQPAAAEVTNQTSSDTYIVIPPETANPPAVEPIGKPPFSKQTGTPPPLTVPSVLGKGTVPLVQKNMPSVLSGGGNAMPADNALATLRGEASPPQIQGRPSVLPRGMNESTPLSMPDSLVFGAQGGNVEKAARAWSIAKTPIFQFVQNSPIMRKSQLNNKIGRIVNRNGVVMGVTKLRLL